MDRGERHTAMREWADDRPSWGRRLAHRCKQQPIATRLAAMIGLLVGLMTAVALILFSLHQTELTAASVARRLDHTAYALADTLASAVAADDRKLIARAAASAAQLGDVASISVIAATGETLFELHPSGETASGPLLRSVATIRAEHGAEHAPLGSILVAARAPDLWSDLRERGPTLAVLASAAALIAAALTDALAQRTHVMPMRELELAMANGRRAMPPADAEIVDCPDFRRLYDRYNLVIDTLEATANELHGRLCELERANAATSRFLAVISHELRTPLNGVLGMAQLLKATPLQERQQDIVATILASGGALSAVIDDVLDASKIDAGLLELSYDLFDLHKTVRRAVEENASMAELKSLELGASIELPDDLRFVGDARRVRQILSKVLNNAVKFTDAGGVTLRVLPDDPYGVRFEVTDTGPGVPQDRREVIFERFRQADDSDTRRHGGTGLGLSISKEVVELMGGRISVDDAEGGGARFVIELPLEQIRAAPEPPMTRPSLVAVETRAARSA